MVSTVPVRGTVCVGSVLVSYAQLGSDSANTNPDTIRIAFNTFMYLLLLCASERCHQAMGASTATSCNALPCPDHHAAAPTIAGPSLIPFRVPAREASLGQACHNLPARDNAVFLILPNATIPACVAAPAVPSDVSEIMLLFSIPLVFKAEHRAGPERGADGATAATGPIAPVRVSATA
jgi:hypothetical protein